MNVHIYAVDFPVAKIKFWNSSIRNCSVTPLSRAEFPRKPDNNDMNIYLFYVRNDEELKLYLSKLNENEELKINFGLIFENDNFLEQISPNKLISNNNCIVLGVDSPEGNLGTVISLNHIVQCHLNEGSLTVKFKNKIHELSSQFDVAIERLEKQLMLARKKFFTKDHSKPIKFNTIQFDYTYRAGSKPGTEYSDFIFWNEWILWLNFSSTSYSDSSVILKYIEDCRKDKENWSAPKLQDIFQQFQKNISSFQTVMNQKIEADYFICLINTKKRSADYIMKGSYECFNQLGHLWEGRQDEPTFRRKELGVGELFLLLTPGVFRNITNESKKNSLRKYVKEYLASLKQEILPEIYLLLEKEQSNFLDYDMNIVYGEVAGLRKN